MDEAKYLVQICCLCTDWGLGRAGSTKSDTGFPKPPTPQIINKERDTGGPKPLIWSDSNVKTIAHKHTAGMRTGAGAGAGTETGAETGTRRLGTAVPHGIILVDRRWRWKVASRFGRKTQSLSGDVITRREPGPGREGGTSDGKRDRVGDGDEDEDGNGHEDRDGGGTGTRTEKGVEGRESPGTYEVIIEVGQKTRERVTPASNQQRQSQDPTPQRDRRIMRMIKAQGREARDRIVEGGEGTKKRKKPQKGFRRDVENRKLEHQIQSGCG